MPTQGPTMPRPQEFAETLAQSDGYELAAARAALAQSRNPQVHAFARQMIADHERLGQALQEAARTSGLEPPRPHVGSDQSRFLAALQSLRGDPFDREYGRQQLLAHSGALAEVRRYADKGSDPDLRRVAASAAPIIERHLQAARALPQPST